MTTSAGWEGPRLWDPPHRWGSRSRFGTGDSSSWLRQASGPGKPEALGRVAESTAGKWGLGPSRKGLGTRRCDSQQNSAEAACGWGCGSVPDGQAGLTPRFTCWGAGCRELGSPRHDHAGPALSMATQRPREVCDSTSLRPMRTACWDWSIHHHTTFSSQEFLFSIEKKYAIGMCLF